MEAAVGFATMDNGVIGTVATLAPFVKSNCTDDGTPGYAPLGVFDAITTAAVVALTNVHDVATVPSLGVAPTLAPHKKPGMKLVPVTVMVLPA